MTKRRFPRLIAAIALAAAPFAPLASQAQETDFETAFDAAFGTTVPARAAIAARVAQPSVQQPVIQQAATVQPVTLLPVPAQPMAASYRTPLEQQVALLAEGSQGRIGVAAVDLSTGERVSILGDQAFPMASTSKIAVVATFLEGVDQGRWKLTDQFPLMLPQPSAKFSTSVAPVRAGAMMSAQELIDLCISRSSNPATDALLAVVGGPQAVNRWLRRAGVSGIRMDRDIATLVRDDGEYNPANTIDQRDSATPLAMVELLGGLYEGQWLSPQSRSVLLGAMGRTVTGKRRLRAQLPEGADIAHKTGTLFNTSSDVGIIQTPDGRAIAIAVYATGQGGKPQRDARIASIARVVYDGYQTEASSVRRTASR